MRFFHARFPINVGCCDTRSPVKTGFTHDLYITENVCESLHCIKIWRCPNEVFRKLVEAETHPCANAWIALKP